MKSKLIYHVLNAHPLIKILQAQSLAFDLSQFHFNLINAIFVPNDNRFIFNSLPFILRYFII